MSEHYIKAKYDVCLKWSNQILIQRDDDCFVFIGPKRYNYWYSQGLENDNFSGWADRMVNENTKWTSEAMDLIKCALEDKLSPFYIANIVANTEKCTCEIFDLMRNGCCCGFIERK